MKDHVRVSNRLSLYDLEGPLERALESIRESAIGIINPQLEIDWDYGIMILGWRPMTAREKQKARELAKKKREADKAKKLAVEEQERKTALLLLAKYPDIIKAL